MTQRFWGPMLITFFGLVLFALCLPVPKAISAPMRPANEACAAWHIVRAGENLTRIAQQYNLTLSQLRALNPHQTPTPNLIHPGLTLCVSLQGAPTPVARTPDDPMGIPEPTFSYVALEVQSMYTRTEDEQGIVVANESDTDAPLIGRMRQTVRYPLSPDAPLRIFNEPITRDFWEGLPVFYTMHGEEVGHYELRLPARQALTESLPLSLLRLADVEGCQTFAPAELVETTALLTPTLTLLLEAPDGLSLPLAVTQVGPHKIDCMENSTVNLILMPLPHDPTYYQLWLLVNGDKAGPPGELHAQNCQTWNQGRGWFYNFIRRLVGC